VCLLCFSPAGTMPRREDIEQACSANPDGFGFAIRIDDKIITSRGLNANKVIDKFFKLKEKYPESDGMFHARLATHGTINNENCHPFRVDNDRRLVLGHNGILPMQVPAQGSRSDTRIFAEDILPAMGIEVLDSYSDRLALEDWLGNNKMVIMSTHPALKKDYYILNEAEGLDDNGVWYSNCSYRPYAARYANPTYNSKYILNSPKSIPSVDSSYDVFNSKTEYCIACDSVLDEQAFYEGYCLTCETCVDCAATFNDCLCYTPAYEGRSANAISQLW
jgi:predicted glutamine amidotransferase